MEPRILIRPEQTRLQMMADRLYQLVFVRDIDFVEILMGLLLIGWGVQLLLPWDTFRGSPSFAALVSIWPHEEWAWGVVFLVIGMLKVGAYLSGHLLFRVAASLITSSAWAFIAGTFGWANPSGTGVVMYTGVSLASTWVFWRLLLSLRGGHHAV